MGGESLNPHQLRLDSLSSILLAVKN